MIAADGIADDTRAAQAAILNGTPFPAGVMKITSTLTLANAIGARIAGAGAGATTLQWAGNAADPMFRLDDVRDATIESFGINSSPAAPLNAAFEMINGSGGTYAPGNRHFRDLSINGTNVGGLNRGFSWISGAGGDNNNDLDVFTAVRVSNYGIAAWISESSQAHGQRFFGCSAFSNGMGRCAVSTRCGAFAWYGGWSGGNTVADFILADIIYNSPVLISGLNSENSARLLETGGPASTYLPVTIEGSRWASGGLNPDGKAIRYQLGGTLSLHGNAIGSDPSRALSIYVNTGPVARFVAMGNNFGSSVNPFAVNPSGGFGRGNTLNTNASPLADFG